MKSTKMAEKNAVVRVCEDMLPDGVRLFNDPYSYSFLTSSNILSIRLMKSKKIYNWLMDFSDKVSPGTNGGLICRIRYIDESLVSAVNEGYEVVVNLGGGYDTRCLRIDNIGQVKYYHIDQPEVIEAFKSRMSKMEGGIPNNITFVPIDFNRQSLSEELEKVGYDKEKRTIFIWEGVSQYLTEDAIEDMLKFVASTRAENRMVFTYVVKEYLDNPKSYPKYENILRLIEKSGIKWLSGISPDNLSDYLGKIGLKLIEDVGDKEYQERYLKPIGRVVDVMPVERTCLCKVI